MDIQIIPLNPISYHVFQWFCHNQHQDLDALVQETYDTVEKGEHYEISTGGVQDSVLPRLAELLDQFLDERYENWISEVSDGRYLTGDEANLLSDPDGRPSSPFDLVDLFVPLAYYVRFEIDTIAIAEAILRSKGKWHKRGPRPEVL